MEICIEYEVDNLHELSKIAFDLYLYSDGRNSKYYYNEKSYKEIHSILRRAYMRFKQFHDNDDPTLFVFIVKKLVKELNFKQLDYFLYYLLLSKYDQDKVDKTNGFVCSDYDDAEKCIYFNLGFLGMAYILTRDID